MIDDQEVAGPDRFVPPEKRDVGLMFQDFALFPHLSILDNVAFGLKSLTRGEAKAEALAALARVGLEHYADDYPHILSGGEQQRVALARAIAPRPSVLLMDEPFSGLDVRLRESMQEETLAILHETRATSIVVTHDPEEAMRLGDRIAVMREGRLVQIGKALDLYREPKDILAARTFSELNEIAGAHRAGQRVDRARPLRRAGLRRGHGRHRLRPAARRPSACRRAGPAGARAAMRASSATSRWSRSPCRASTRRSSPGSGRATCRQKAPRSASPSIRRRARVRAGDGGQARRARVPGRA